MIAPLSTAPVDVVYFVYGLAFLVMGIAILTQPRKDSAFKLADSIWLLAWFGIVHSLHEFSEMWSIIKKAEAPLQGPFEWACLVGSYCFLLEAGRRFATLGLGERRRASPAGLLELPARWVYPVLLAWILALSGLAPDFWATGRALSRYLLGLPGGLLTGLGLWGYWRREQAALAGLGVRKYFLLAGLAFIAYGLLGGVVVGPADFFPADRLNTESFLAVVGLRAEWLRALSAVVICWGVVGILRIFDWEVRERVQTSLTESSQDCILHVSLGGKLISVNRAYAARHLPGRATPVSGRDATFNVVENREGLAYALQRAGRGETVSLQYACSGQSGLKVTYDAVASPVRGLDGRVESVVVVARDFTERKWIEAALHQSEARFHALAENALIGIYMMKENRFVYVNPAFAEMFGYSPEEVLALPSFQELVMPEDREKVAEQVRLRQTGARKTTRYAFTGRRRDGTAVRGEVMGSTMEGDGGKLVVGMLRDITQAESQAAELRRNYESQEVLNRILRASVKPGSLLEVLDRAFDELFHIPWFDIEPRGALFLVEDAPETLVLKTHRGFSAEQLQTCGRVPFGRCLCGRAARSRDCVCATSADACHELREGGAAPHAHYCVPIRAGGEVLGLINLYTKPDHVYDEREKDFLLSVADVFCGIILRKRAEEAMRKAQKLEAIGLLTGGVVHDFNNMLTLILGYNYLLQEGLPPGPLQGFAGEIGRSVELSASLTRQLLAVSRRQVSHRRYLDLNALAIESGRMLQRLLSADIELETRVDSKLWPVQADPGQVEQVLLNLVVNARDAMPQGGRLEIETDNHHEVRPGAQANPAAELAPGDYVCLSVRDTGMGMDESVRRRIFEPFFTTKEAGRGTGLGLATVLAIVREHGGGVSVESVPGQGSVFRVYLPRAQGGVAAMLPGQAPGELRGGSETILVLEDHEDLRRLISLSLSEKGYEVLQAARGQEAVRVAQAHGKPVALVLADLVLPDMTGKEAVGRLQKLCPGIRTLFMSGYAGAAAAQVAQSADSVLLEKPFSPAALLRALREALDAPAAVRTA